jgi:hypothetical protein
MTYYGSHMENLPNDVLRHIAFHCLDKNEDIIAFPLVFVCKRFHTVLTPSQNRRDGTQPVVRFVTRAASDGYLSLLQWALSIQLVDTSMVDFGRVVSWHAAKQGHLAILEWASQLGLVFAKQVCYAAAETGQLETLKWLHARGGHWQDEVLNYCAHLPILQWAKSMELPFSLEFATRTAIYAGNRQLVQWLLDEGVDLIELEKYGKITDYDLDRTSLSIILWLHDEYGLTLTHEDCANLAYYGNFEGLKRLHSLGLGLIGVLRAALQHSPRKTVPRIIEILEWAYSNGAPDLRNITWWYWNGQLDVLKWLYVHGVPLNETAFVVAIELNSPSEAIEVSQWLLAQQCRWNDSVCCAAVRCHQTTEVFDWLCNHGAPFNAAKLRQALEAKVDQSWRTNDAFRALFNRLYPSVYMSETPVNV